MMIRMCLICLLLSSALPLSAEHLFLIDGSIIKGTVISETTASVMFRKNNDDNITRYSRDDVLRIVYTEINIDRMYVQTRTGKNFKVYIVDEDRTSYTFRKELNNPEEFKINRSEILFMADRNPADLKGIAAEDKIDLEWLPSFEEMKYYNIYIKKKGGEFSPAATSKKTVFTLKGLDSGSEYTVKVTGLTKQGEETASSNEYRFRTNAAVKTEIIPEIVEKPHAIEKPAEKESTLSKAAGSMSFTGGVLLTSGNLSDISSHGYGGSVTLLKQNMLISGDETGLSIGFYSLNGSESDSGSTVQSDSAFFVPMSLSYGYRFRITEKMVFTPAIFAGAVYYNLSYKEISGVYENKKFSETGPSGGAGFSIEYPFADMFNFYILIQQGFLLTGSPVNYPYTRLEMGARLNI